MSLYPRTEYKMTQADLDAILDACKPTRVMFLSGGTPMGGTPQENANRAWAALGAKMGFDYMTAQPIRGKGMLHFTAVPSEIPEARAEREARQAEEKRLQAIAEHEAAIKTHKAALAKLKASNGD